MYDSRFENFITGSILINTVVMSLNHFMMNETFEGVCDVLNYIFMAIFTIEATIKIIALRRDYFKDGWNIFDFTVVSLTTVILVL